MTSKMSRASDVIGNSLFHCLLHVKNSQDIIMNTIATSQSFNSYKESAIMFLCGHA